MGDNDSPPLFKMMFDYLAETPNDIRAREFAAKLFEESRGFDFSNSEMEADEALEKLGLAYKKDSFDPLWDDDGYIYAGDKEFDPAKARAVVSQTNDDSES